MPKKNIPQNIMRILRSVEAKRARTAIEHIIEHGLITTEELKEKYGERCHICSASFEERYLQIDHRVPYEVAGDDVLPNRNFDHYMLVCSSCNRAKSWSCEHCLNWAEKRDPDICQSCYWASPINYAHVAMRDIRRLAMVWQKNEARQYDTVKKWRTMLKRICLPSSKNFFGA